MSVVLTHPTNSQVITIARAIASQVRSALRRLRCMCEVPRARGVGCMRYRPRKGVSKKVG